MSVAMAGQDNRPARQHQGESAAARSPAGGTPGRARPGASRRYCFWHSTSTGMTTKLSAGTPFEGAAASVTMNSK